MKFSNKNLIIYGIVVLILGLPLVYLGDIFIFIFPFWFIISLSMIIIGIYRKIKEKQ